MSTNGDAFSMFKVSFNWFSFIGTIVVWIVGVPISYFFGPAAHESLDPNLISPVAWRLLPKRLRQAVMPRTVVSSAELQCNYCPVNEKVESIGDEWLNKEGMAFIEK